MTTLKLASCIAVLVVAAPQPMAIARVLRTCQHYHDRCMQLREDPEACANSLAAAMSAGNADIGYWQTNYDGKRECLKKR